MCISIELHIFLLAQYFYQVATSAIKTFSFGVGLRVNMTADFFGFICG